MHKFEIEAEKQKYEINRLSLENDEIGPLVSKCNLLQQEMRQNQAFQGEIETLRSQLAASLDDRQVYEQRYLQCIEALKIGQIEIDKRHSLVLDLHQYSIDMSNDFSSLERENKRIEVELENRKFEIEALRQNSLPENLAHLSQRLSEMENDRTMREKRMQKALTSADPEMNRMIADQTDTIVKLKNDLTSKNNQFNRAQLQIKEMETALIQLREQINSANYVIT